MFEIKCKINGKEIDLDDFEDELRKATFKALIEDFRDQFKSVRCSVHKTGPKLSLEGKDFDHLKVIVDGCCDEFEEKVVKEIEGGM